MTIKVVSWNIWFGKHYHDIITYLKTAEADVIGLQEVIQDADGKHNTAENIAKELGYHWKYEETMQVDLDGKAVSWGNAVLSKYPITSSKLHELPEGNDRRTALETAIEIDGKTFTIVSTHLLHTHQKPSGVQEKQAQKILKIIPKERGIVMGDFNATPESNAVQIVSAKLNCTDTQLDPTAFMYIEGCTVCKIDEVILRLDYIFATKDLKVHSFETGYSKGSDHLPIATSFEI